MAKPKNKEATETTAPETAAPETPAPGALAVKTSPSPAMLALFSKPVNLQKARRLNLPPMLLPGEIPIWTPENQAVLVVEVVKATNSPASTVKGKCLWVKCGDGAERLLPVTGTIRQALAPSVPADSDDLLKALDKLAGKTLAFKRLDDKVNKHYKKDMYIFEVFMLD